jgi:hypothetical protein
MKTLTTLANELLEEIHAINNTSNFNYSSSYETHVALRMIKSSNVIQSRYSFSWDNVSLLQDTLELLEDGPPTRIRQETLFKILSREDATA